MHIFSMYVVPCLAKYDLLPTQASSRSFSTKTPDASGQCGRTGQGAKDGTLFPGWGGHSIWGPKLTAIWEPTLAAQPGTISSER